MTPHNPTPQAFRPRVDGLIHYLNPLQLVKTFWRYRSLLRQLTAREIEARYKGSVLGMLWSFITPLVMLLIYTFVFGVIFKARFADAPDDRLGALAIVLFCGLSAFNVFAECVSRAGSLIVSVPNFVKKVIFPLELLPLVIMGSALLQGLISLGILVVANMIMTGQVPVTVALMPLVSVPLIFLTLGVSWFLASVGVFARDVQHSVGLFLQMLFFGTPIFYPISAVPEGFRRFLLFNPLAVIVDDFRRVVLWNLAPMWPRFIRTVIVSGIVMMAGYAWFMKSKRAFADVL